MWTLASSAVGSSFGREAVQSRRGEAISIAGQSQRRVLAALIALALALAGLLAQAPDAAAAKCWQPDGPGTPYVCTAP